MTPGKDICQKKVILSFAKQVGMSACLISVGTGIQTEKDLENV